MTDVNNSGAELPAAMKVAPATSSLRCKRCRKTHQSHWLQHWEAKGIKLETLNCPPRVGNCRYVSSFMLIKFKYRGKSHHGHWLLKLASPCRKGRLWLWYPLQSRERPVLWTTARQFHQSQFSVSSMTMNTQLPHLLWPVKGRAGAQAWFTPSHLLWYCFSLGHVTCPHPLSLGSPSKILTSYSLPLAVPRDYLKWQFL